MAKDILGLYQTLGNIVQSARKHISEVHPRISIGYHKVTMTIRDCVTNIDDNNFVNFLINPNKETNLDSLDLKLLKVLSINAREKLTLISKQLQTTPEIIRYRIKRLLKDKIILGFYTRTNKHRSGLSTYMLLLNLAEPPNQKDKYFFANQDNVYHVKECIGDWNLIVHFSSGSNSKLISTLDKIRGHFSGKLNKFTLLILLERHYFAPLPKNIPFGP